jgi:hypothetical protein
MEFLREEDEAGVGAPPKDGLVLREPWKYAAAVGREKKTRRQVAAITDDALLVGRLGRRKGKIDILGQVRERLPAAGRGMTRHGINI